MNLSFLNKFTLSQLKLVVHGVGVAGIFAIPLICYSCFAAASGQESQQLMDAIAHDQELVENRIEVTEQYELTNCELYALQQRLEDLRTLIPGKPEESRFLAQLSGLAREAELGIRNFRPGPAEDSDQLKRIRVQLTGIGTYECLCRFLDGLGSLPRLTQVSMLKVDPANSDGQYPVTLELSIFFSGGKDKAAKVARHD